MESRVPALLEQTQRIWAIPAKTTDQPRLPSRSVTELPAILNVPDLQTRSGLRDRAMLPVCVAAGLRGSERLTGPLTALTWQPTATLHRQGKGRRHRARPLGHHTAEAVRAWRAVRGHVAVPERFVSAPGRAMTRGGFTSRLRQYGQQAVRACPAWQGQQVSPQVLRQTCAMMSSQATGDRRKVSRWLGPADLQATAVYVRADPTATLDALEAILPPSLRRGQFTVPDRLIAMLHGP